MMQIPGANCGVCGQKIVVAPDGTWCTACKSLFHTACLAEHGDVCPTCNAKYMPPERAALRDAQGRTHSAEHVRNPVRLGPTLEIIAGGLLLVSPVVFIIMGIAFSLAGGSNAGLFGVLPFMIIFMILGVVLVVDGERNFRGGRQQQN